MRREFLEAVVREVLHDEFAFPMDQVLLAIDEGCFTRNEFAAELERQPLTDASFSTQSYLRSRRRNSCETSEIDDGTFPTRDDRTVHRFAGEVRQPLS
ncbi:MAG: hypothetical protein R3B96_09600 [Pirellulaceae bacterium]